MESSLPEHLDILENAAAQAKQLTTSQIAQLLGISKSSVTKNQESFEYEGFRFSRAGRIGRELAWQVTKLKK
jgi:DNA-binding MurR/RpiR family transcriptional regulator